MTTAGDLQRSCRLRVPTFIVAALQPLSEAVTETAANIITAIATLETIASAALTAEDLFNQEQESYDCKGYAASLLVAGLLFGSRALTLGDETRDCAASCNWASETSKQSDGQWDATVGKIFDGVGLAAVVVGVGEYIYRAHERQPALALQPGTRGAMLSWSSR